MRRGESKSRLEYVAKIHRAQVGGGGEIRAAKDTAVNWVGAEGLATHRVFDSCRVDSKAGLSVDHRRCACRRNVARSNVACSDVACGKVSTHDFACFG